MRGWLRALVSLKARGGFPPRSVNDGREHSHDSHATEDEQDMQEGLPVKANKGYGFRQIQGHQINIPVSTPQNKLYNVLFVNIFLQSAAGMMYF